MAKLAYTLSIPSERKVSVQSWAGHGKTPIIKKLKSIEVHVYMVATPIDYGPTMEDYLWLN